MNSFQNVRLLSDLDFINTTIYGKRLTFYEKAIVISKHQKLDLGDKWNFEDYLCYVVGEQDYVRCAFESQYFFIITFNIYNICMRMDLVDFSMQRHTMAASLSS